MEANGENQIVEASAVESIERAMVDVQVATANKYKRPEFSIIRDNMLGLATLDEETAASCFYTLPRGGKAIQGASIRMAEIAVSQYQNIRVSTRIIAMVTTGDAPYVVVQGIAFDLQKNVASCIEKRRRIVKKKFKDAIDEDDINLAVNACSSIAYRDSTFKVIPLALIKPVVEAAKRTAIGDVRSLVAKRTEVIDRLNKMGAPIDRILAVIEARTIEDIDVEKLQQLIGLGTALKEGDTTLEEAFPLTPKAEPPAKGNAAVAEKLSKGKKEEEPKKPDTKPAEKKKTEPPKKGDVDIRMKWVCDGCGMFLPEKGVCPTCKSGKEVREATEKDYDDLGYKK
jgi:hypothetical protein